MVAQPLASQRLHAIAARMKAQGERGLRLEMNRALRAGAQPLVTAVRASARAKLPKTGGLNVEQATQPIRVSVLTGSRSAGVRIRTRTPGSMQTNDGYVRHPTEGHRDRWVRQEIPEAEGWWTDPMTVGSPAITPLLVRELDRVARRMMGY